MTSHTTLRDLIDVITVLAGALVWLFAGTAIVVSTYTVGGLAGAFIAMVVFAGASAWLLEEIGNG